MEEEQSIFEKFSDSQLKKYMKYFFSVVGDEEFMDPMDLLDIDETTYKKLKAPVGREFDRLDFEYLYYIVSNNQRDHLVHQGIEIDRPQLGSKYVVYSEWYHAIVKDSHGQDMNTYLGDSLEPSYLSSLRREGFIDPSDWDNIDQDIDYNEYRDEEWDID